MADLETGIFSYLSGHTGVHAAVADRIYPFAVPQEMTLPAVAYQRVSGNRMLAHDGGPDFAEARIQFTCVADTYGEAKDGVRAIREAMHGFRGILGSVRVARCKVEAEYDGYATASAKPTVRLDVAILYQET